MNSLEDLLSIQLCSTKTNITNNELKKLNLKNNLTKNRSLLIKKNLFPNGEIKWQFTWIYPNLKLTDLKKKIDTYEFNDDNKSEYDPLQIIFQEEYNAIMNSVLDDDSKKINNIKNLLKKYVKKVIEERFQPIMKNVEFIYTDDNIPRSECKMRISFLSDGCSTSFYPDISTRVRDVGSIKPNRGTVDFGGWFNISTVIHEIGHAIGLEHEHQSLCGFKPVWDNDLLYLYFKITDNWGINDIKSNITNKINDNYTFMNNYDPYSIMIYGIPSKLTLNGVGSKKNYKFSSNDIYFINLIYGKKKTIEELKEWYYIIYNQPFILTPGSLLNSNNENNFSFSPILYAVLFILLCIAAIYLVPILKKNFKIKKFFKHLL